MKPSMFIKIDGHAGESQDTSHEGWIDVLSWSWGGSQGADAHVGRGRSMARVQVDDLSFIKFVDKSTPGLLHSMFVGKHIAKCELHCTKATGNDLGGDLNYIIIKMEEVIISAISTGGASHEDRMTENVSLAFAKVEYQYTVQGDDGGVGAKPRVEWDVAAGKGNVS